MLIIQARCIHYVLSVGIDVERAAEAADDADEDEHVDLEDVEGERDAEPGREHRDDRVDLAPPHGDQAEEDGSCCALCIARSRSRMKIPFHASDAFDKARVRKVAHL